MCEKKYASPKMCVNTNVCQHKCVSLRMCFILMIGWHMYDQVHMDPIARDIRWHIGHLLLVGRLVLCNRFSFKWFNVTTKPALSQLFFGQSNFGPRSLLRLHGRREARPPQRSQFRQRSQPPHPLGRDPSLTRSGNLSLDLHRDAHPNLRIDRSTWLI